MQRRASVPSLFPCLLELLSQRVRGLLGLLEPRDDLLLPEAGDAISLLRPSADAG